MELAQRILHLRQRSGRQVQQCLTRFEQPHQLLIVNMASPHTEGRLNNRYGKSLAAIAQIRHVATLGQEQLPSRVVTIRSYQVIELILCLLKVRLAVPQCVIGINSHYFYLIHHKNKNYYMPRSAQSPRSRLR